MQRMYVIFDTNVYRGIGQKCFEELLKREREHSIVGLCNPWTAVELLAHLTCPEDTEFGSCRSAIGRLVQRCSQPYNESTAVRFLPDAQSQRCSILFGSMPNGVEQQAHVYGNLLATIAKAEIPADWQAQQSQVNDIAKSHRQAKKDFQDAVLEFIQSYVPAATSWNAITRDASLRNIVVDKLKDPVVKRSTFAFLVDETAKCLGKTLSPSCREERIDLAMRAFAIPMQFAFSRVYGLIVQGANFSNSKNVNSSEDFQILFSVSSMGTIDGMATCLITNEIEMKKAAIDCGSPDLVRSVSAYLDFLGVDPTICGNVNTQVF